LGTADKTLEYAERFGAGGVGGLHGSATFMVKRETGLEEIRPFITGDPDNEVGTWGLGLLAVYTELGMERAALMTLDTLMATGESSGAAGRYEGGQAAFLTEAVFMLRHREYADALFEILRPRAGTNLLSGHFVNVFGSADRYLGMLASLLGRDAGEHFEAAIEMDRGMGSTHHQAESQARYAQWLRPHDPARATELAGRARATAQRMGSTRIQRMLEPRRGQKDSVLTPRELEVLQLVARGYSNHAISQELFISQNTAANHVRNILIKTDSDNRTQAARYASDRRLFDD
jgi:DNA-binding CsgD family transcriptional regulator